MGLTITVGFTELDLRMLIASLDITAALHGRFTEDQEEADFAQTQYTEMRQRLEAALSEHLV
jgi:hypothetical protein